MKIVKEERLDIILEITREGGTGPVEVSCRTDYEVTAEGLTENRSLSSADDPLTLQEINAIKSFAARRLQRVKQLEA